MSGWLVSLILRNSYKQHTWFQSKVDLHNTTSLESFIACLFTFKKKISNYVIILLFQCACIKFIIYVFWIWLSFFFFGFFFLQVSFLNHIVYLTWCLLPPANSEALLRALPLSGEVVELSLKLPCPEMLLFSDQLLYDWRSSGKQWLELYWQSQGQQSGQLYFYLL